MTKLSLPGLVNANSIFKRHTLIVISAPKVGTGSYHKIGCDPHPINRLLVTPYHDAYAGVVYVYSPRNRLTLSRQDSST